MKHASHTQNMTQSPFNRISVTIGNGFLKLVANYAFQFYLCLMK